MCLLLLHLATVFLLNQTVSPKFAEPLLSLRLERYQPMWEEGPFDECAVGVLG